MNNLVYLDDQVDYRNFLHHTVRIVERLLGTSNVVPGGPTFVRQTL